MVVRSIVHFEIPSKDHDKTKKFYSGLFGWQFEAVPVPQSDEIYNTLFMPEANMGCGLTEISEHNKPGDVLVYIGTDDIDADIKKIEELGGTITMPRHEIPGMGSFAVFVDVVGNRLALWQAADKA